MKNIAKKFVVVASCATALFCATGAQAQGFLGQIIEQIAPGVGTQLDEINRELGQPVDHAIAAGMDVVVPGSGTAVEAGWALQRMHDNAQNSVYPELDNVVPNPRAGNMCTTPAGRFGPGPVNPLGAPCHVFTPYGVVMGAVTQ